MKPSLQKLQKFLKLEAERGYDNRAVVGGLDRMLGPWEAEARVDSLPEDLIEAITTRLRDYPRLSPVSRAETLEGLWKRLQRESGVELSPLPAPPIEKPAPPPSEPVRVTSAADTAAPNLAPRKAVSRLPRESRSAPAPEGPVAALNAPVTVLPGVGPRHGATLGRLGLATLGDMLYFFPRRYDDYTQLKPINRLWYGEEVTVIGTIQSINLRRFRQGSGQLTEAIINDGSGALRVTWWNPYINKRVRAGMQVVLSGKVEQYLGRLVMSNPEVEPLEQQNLSTNRIVPVYPLTANITQRWLRARMYEVVSYWAPRLPDPLPDDLRDRAGLIDLSTALLQAHYPDSHEKLQAARHRLAFDEIFLLQLGVLHQKRQWQDHTARVFATPADWLAGQIARLPYTLTGAQQRALADLRTDLASGRPMNRLLQGDVGSGKTIVAALGMAMVTRHGAQAAIMAPTSILAEQHYKNLLKILAEISAPVLESPTAVESPAVLETSASSETPVSSETPASSETPTVLESPASSDTPASLETPVASTAPLTPGEIRLMVGSTPETERREILEGLASGAIKVLVGTHALIEDPVAFANLQFIVIDEQHRFGVDQRAALRAKGQNPHLLVMTATPIPRSLSLTVYGDLDLSIMDEMPSGRQPIETQVYFPRERERAYVMVRSEIECSHQAFIIYPLVEESENSDRAAVEEHARLQKDIFPHYRLGLLHGRLKPDEKEAVMADFRDGKIQVLISTSVVEVGVDVPNATLMIIEGANRFGLAQLHQFRGRVGRGVAQSYCILIPETPDEAENARLQAMVETNDGFLLAERDLEQRGPGDFLGTRQAGFSDLKLASLTDIRLIEKARQHAQSLFEQDPELELPEHQRLAVTMKHFWGGSAAPVKGDLS